MRADEGIKCTKVCSSVSFPSLTHFNAPSPSACTFFNHVILLIVPFCHQSFSIRFSTSKNSPFSLLPAGLPLLIWVSILSVWPSLNDSVCVIRISLRVLSSRERHQSEPTALSSSSHAFQKTATCAG